MKSAARRKVLIVGAGLSGAWLAYELAELGFDIEIFEEESSFAMKASGNRHAFSFPSVSVEPTALMAISLCGQTILKNFVVKNPSAFGESFPILRIFDEEKEYRRIKKAWDGSQELQSLSYWGTPSDLQRWIPALPTFDIWIWKEAWCLSFPDLCGYLFESHLKAITIHFNTAVESVHESDSTAWIETNSQKFEGDFVVLCNGHQIKNIINSPWPLRKVKGQISVFESESHLFRKRALLNSKKFLFPLNDGLLIGGASFQREFENLDPTVDHAISVLESFDPLLQKQELAKLKPKSFWTQIRTSTPGQAPIVGRLSQYQSIYCSTAFGSKGSLYIPAASRWLAEKLAGSNERLTESLDPWEKYFSPQRFD